MCSSRLILKQSKGVFMKAQITISLLFLGIAGFSIQAEAGRGGSVSISLPHHPLSWVFPVEVSRGPARYHRDRHYRHDHGRRHHRRYHRRHYKRHRGHNFHKMKHRYFGNRFFKHRDGGHRSDSYDRGRSKRGRSGGRADRGRGSKRH